METLIYRIEAQCALFLLAPFIFSDQKGKKKKKKNRKLNSYNDPNKLIMKLPWIVLLFLFAI